MTSIAPTTPTTAPSSDAPTTLADASPSLAAQLYTTPPVVPQATATPVTVAPTEQQPPTDGTPATDDGPEFSQDEQGRWHRADGTMASADELAQIEAQLADAEKTKAEADANRPSTVVPIRGRNGEMVEVEAPDDETAQLLRQNVNDGMRRREFTEKMAEVQAREAEIQELGTRLRTNPELLFDEMPEDVQVRILSRGLARHFDALIPVIQGYDTNPSSRIAAVAEMQRAVREQEVTFKQTVEAQRRSAEVRQSVEALIPETANEADISEFMQLAHALLVNHINAGNVVDATTAPKIVSGLAAKYGFSSAAPAAPSRPRITLASAKPAAPAAGTPTPAKPNNQRLRLASQRRNAAAIPPHGRSGPATPAALPADRAFQDAANALYGNTTRAS